MMQPEEGFVIHERGKVVGWRVGPLVYTYNMMLLHGSAWRPIREHEIPPRLAGQGHAARHRAKVEAKP